jgi:hypothetical protein
MWSGGSATIAWSARALRRKLRGTPLDLVQQMNPQWAAALRDKGLVSLADDGTEIVALAREDGEPVTLTEGGATVPDYELRRDGSMVPLTPDDLTNADFASAIVQLAGRQEALEGRVAAGRDRELSAATAALSDLARAAMPPGDVGDLAAGPERVPVGDVLAARYRGTGRGDVYLAVRGLAEAWHEPMYVVRERLEEYAETHLGLSSSNGEDWALMAAAADLGGSGSQAAPGSSMASEVVALAAPSGESAGERRSLAAKGWALPDGSYPIPDIKHLHSAAVLAASKHGDWKAARRLIAGRARDLGVPLSELPGFGDGKAAASNLLEQADALQQIEAGQMAGTGWVIGTGGTLGLAGAGEPGTSYYGPEVPLHAAHVGRGGHYDNTAAAYDMTGSKAELARLTALYAAEDSNLVALAAPGSMHDGHPHRHRHDGGADWHDGHGPPLDENGEHVHPHEHGYGAHAHGHSEADLQEARNPGFDIRRQPADVAPREPQVPPSSPWAQPGRADDRAQREVDRITAQHAAEFHGGVNKTVTSRTRAHVEDEDPRDRRQPRGPDRVHPAYLETLDPRVQAIVRADPYGLSSTGTRFGRSAPLVP